MALSLTVVDFDFRPGILIRFLARMIRGFFPSVKSAKFLVKSALGYCVVK